MTKAKGLNANHRTILERVAQEPARYVFAPHGKGVKLVRSNLSSSLKKVLEELAHSGHVARASSGDPTGCPPEMSITFTITSLGREELDLHARVKPDTRVSAPLTDAELLAQSQG